MDARREQTMQFVAPVMSEASERELERKNLVLGLALFALFLVLFCAVIAAAFVYLAVD
jgi:hypothetical protein